MNRRIKHFLLLLIFVIVPMIALSVYFLREERALWFMNNDSYKTISFYSVGRQSHNVFLQASEDHLYTAYIPSEHHGETHIDLKYARYIEIDNVKYHSGDRLIQYEPGKEMEFAVYTSSPRPFLEGKIRFFYADNVPSLYIDTASGSMDAINEDFFHDTYEEAHFMAVDEAHGSTIGICTIKGHGNTTWGMVKKPYTMECASADSILGMDPSEKWTLLANVYDGSELKNWIVLNTAKRMNMPVTRQCEYANLFLNGQYNGLYLIAQHVDVKEGYLLEVSFLEDDHLLVETDNSRIFIDCPKDPNSDEYEYLSGLLKSTEKAIYQKENNSYSDYIDLDSWSKGYALQEFFANEDYDRYSFYMYMNSLDDKIIYGPPWDFDICMGVSRKDKRMWVARTRWLKKRYDHLINIHGEYLAGWLYPIYMNHSGFRSKVRDDMRETLIPIVSEMLRNDIPDKYDEIRNSLELDYIRWPQSVRKNDYQEGYEKEYEFVVEWLAERIRYYSK